MELFNEFSRIDFRSFPSQMDSIVYSDQTELYWQYHDIFEKLQSIKSVRRVKLHLSTISFEGFLDLINIVIAVRNISEQLHINAHRLTYTKKDCMPDPLNVGFATKKEIENNF